MKNWMFTLMLLSAVLLFSACSSDDPFGSKNTTTTTTSTDSDGNGSSDSNENDSGETGDSNSGCRVLTDNEGGSGAESCVATTAASSHNFGNNCMSCHSAGGSGEKVFTTSGSIYNSLGTSKTSGTVNVYVYPQSGLTGTPVIIPVDASGNFYTTASLTLGSTKIVSSTGSTRTMSMTPTAGCTSCHSDAGSQSTLKLD